MKHFKFYNKQDILSLTRLRRFETKLGERLQVANGKESWEQAINNSTANFVLFGIPEDIGVRANHGMAGSDSAWLPFLQSFLNIQSNDFLSGDDMLLTRTF